ncbi:glycoside hydrolase family protein [Novosphingobium sp. 1949]|uniref:Glycoside hydrolase family protein n=1 Tax=Novosphingobium organovorum TaxID=2930092 RepID=A0ABT0BCT1_9SPHN|nr:glycosyl hydrolase [Novosphingobium organovorum]MCJ2182890.1 glycoside hydrolase family protein [Novosphingobium organovorum]
MTRRTLMIAASAAAMLAAMPGCTTALAEATPATGATGAQVAIDFSAPGQVLRRTERFNNLTDYDLYVRERPEDMRFYNEQGLHGSIYRVWLANSLYDPHSQTYDIAALRPYLKDASTVSDAVMLNVMPSNLITQGLTPAQIKPILKTLILALKREFPQLDYIEAFNEPDHSLSKELKPEDLYAYYVPFYEAVNEVNAQLKPTHPVRLGGPALFMFNMPWIDAFLDGYKADPNPAKKLDFLSYHAYGYFDLKPGTTQLMKPPVFFKDDPSEVARHRPQIEAALRERGLNAHLPSYITEMGLYPGPSFDDFKDPHADYIRQAAGAASLLYWMLESPDNVPFNWVMRHQTEERKDQLITRAGKDKAIPTRTFSPYGNAMVMFSKLKALRVPAQFTAPPSGKGLYTLATKDKTGLAVLAWNYQHTGTQTVSATIDFNALPKSLRGKPARVKIYRIDATTSNYWSDPEHANLQETSDTAVRLTTRYAQSVSLTPNALELIVVEPAG